MSFTENHSLAAFDLYTRYSRTHIPEHTTTSSVNVPSMMPPTSDVIVKTVEGIVTVAMPEIVHVVASSVRPVGREGLMAQSATSGFSGRMLTLS